MQACRLADRSTEILRSGWPIDSQIFSDLLTCIAADSKS
jgi:hypothetical protein